MSTAPLQFLLMTFAGWVNRRQLAMIGYLKEENLVLRQQLGGGRLRVTDEQRRRLAVKGRVLGRRVLDELTGLVTPDTILRWYRELIATKHDGTVRRGAGQHRRRVIWRGTGVGLLHSPGDAVAWDVRRRPRHRPGGLDGVPGGCNPSDGDDVGCLGVRLGHGEAVTKDGDDGSGRPRRQDRPRDPRPYAFTASSASGRRTQGVARANPGPPLGPASGGAPAPRCSSRR